jgi:hypothetical protein
MELVPFSSEIKGKGISEKLKSGGKQEANICACEINANHTIAVLSQQ